MGRSLPEMKEKRTLTDRRGHFTEVPSFFGGGAGNPFHSIFGYHETLPAYAVCGDLTKSKF
jgi:hypothetical protein